MQKLDVAYRVSEKEEIQKMRQLGKNPKEILERQQQVEDDDVDEIIKQELIQDQDRTVSVKHGKNFDRIEVSNSMDDVPDPRIHGAKIIFDSRMDDTLNQNLIKAQPKKVKRLCLHF